MDGGVTISDAHFRKAALAAVSTEWVGGRQAQVHEYHLRDAEDRRWHVGIIVTACLDAHFGGEAPVLLWFPRAQAVFLSSPDIQACA